MNQKRTKWIIAGLVVVAVAAAVVLIITIFGDKGGTVKREPTPTIPAEIPAGSVLVWRRSAEYFTKTGMKERLLYRYEYDEYGRCVKVEQYSDDEDSKKMTRVVSYVYDETTHNTTEIEIRDPDEDHPDRFVTVYDQNGERISWICLTYSWIYDDYIKESEDIWEQNAFGKYVCAANIIYYRSTGSLGNVSWRSYDEETRTEYWKECTLDNTDKRQDKADWRSIVENEGKDVFVRTITEYDPQGRVLRSREYSRNDVDGEPDVVTTEVESTIAADGTRTETSANSTGEKTVTVYDAQERVIQRTFYEADGTKRRESTYTFEELADGGRRETTESYDFKENNRYHSVDEYNKDGKLVLRTALVDGEETVLTRVVYDEQGREIRWERPSQIMQYEYDEHGNYVKSIFDLGDGEETIHQVEEFVHSPLVLEQDKVEHGKEFFCPVDFEP